MARAIVFLMSVLIGSITCFIQAEEIRVIRKSSYIRYTEEKIGDKTFVHRIDLVDGALKERWAINGKKVAEQDYEEALLEAEKELKRLERHKEEEQRKKDDEAHIKQQAFMQKAKIANHKKQLSLLISQIEDEKKRINDDKLKPYYSYSPSTIDSDLVLQDLDAKLLKGRMLLDSQEATEEDLSESLSSLESMPERLREFFRDTVKKAIDTGTDTKLLKELLATLE